MPISLSATSLPVIRYTSQVIWSILVIFSGECLVFISFMDVKGSSKIHFLLLLLLLLLLLQPFYGPWTLSGTTQLSRYQKGKTSLDLLEQEIVSGSGISWAICKSAPRPRQITTPTSHHSVFYRPDALPATQPTVLKH